MIGVILCTHSQLASGLKKAVEMIGGEQENFDAVCFMNGDDVETLQTTLFDLGEKYRNQNIPYCYIVDLFGATPFNCALYACAQNHSIVMCGANLPLLLEVLLSRSMFDGVDLKGFLDQAMDNTKDSMKIIDTSELFSEE